MYPVPAREDERLDVLRDLRILGTPRERSFDALCRTAQRMFEVPIALVSLVEADRQWFKATCGLDVDGTAREVSFCAHAITSDDVFVVDDATRDPRFADNPLVTGTPHIRFYAGAPLIMAPGLSVGTLCVIDTVPRSFTPAQRAALADLGAIVAAQLSANRDRAQAQAESEARRRSEMLVSAKQEEVARAETLLREIIETIPDAVATFDKEDRLILFNTAYTKFYATSAPFIRLGATFEEMVRAGVARGQYPEAGETPESREAWIAQRLAAHRRDLNERVLQRLDDGRWLQITERISASGFRVGVRTDVTELKRAELQVRRAAESDPLTGLANRDLLWRRLDAALAGRRGEQDRGALVLLDIDHFKAFNDTLGHDAGDAILRATGRRLRDVVRESDLVARLGGDEFAVLIGGVCETRDLERVIAKIHARLTEPVALGGKAIAPGISMGAALYPTDGATAQDLFKNADVALYKAKQSGRNCWSFFDPALGRRVERRRFVAERLREALARGEIDVALQQQVRIADMRHVGFEALARWTFGDEVIAPDEFVRVAEEAGLAYDLGAAVLERALAKHAAVAARGVDAGRLAVNVEAAQLLDARFPDLVATLLARHGLAPHRLELEITEGVLLDRSAERIGKTLGTLASAGIGVALDDFGTGYASLAHLKQFPVTALKIDKSFVRDIEHDQSDAAIVRAVIGLAESLGLAVIAEGVETRAQLHFLRREGCRSVQGYLVGRPEVEAGLLAAAATRNAA